MDLEVLSQLNDFISQNGVWAGQLAALLVTALLVSFVSSRMLNKLHHQLQKTKNVWDDAFVVAMIKPVSLLIWILTLVFSAQILQDYLDQNIIKAAALLRDVGVIAVFAWLLIRFINQAENNLLEVSKEKCQPLDQTTADAVSKLLRISVFVVTTIVILQTLGFSVSGVMAFGGIGGIAVGFAAKDLLANFFGGLMIYLDRPFKVGDWVRSPDREIEGTVERIGWRLTCIRTFDKRPIYVPNAVFANIAVENPSRMSHRRIYEIMGLRYEDAEKMPVILMEIKSMLMEHPEIDTSQTLMVNFNEYGESSLDFFIYTFTKTTVWTHFHEIKQDVLLKIYQIIQKHDADIAFPTTTLSTSEPLNISQV